MSSSLRFLVGALLGTLACGGTQLEGLDAGSDAASDALVDGTSDAAPDASACVASPKAGTPCVPGQVTCDHVDGCCVPVLGCNSTSKTWEVLAVGCACAGHPCGSKTCSGTEMCVERGTGVDGGGGSSFECAPYPDACKSNWTCDCVKGHLPPSCFLAPVGGCKDTPFPVRLTCMGM
jgi:hypothetical protein